MAAAGKRLEEDLSKTDEKLLPEEDDLPIPLSPLNLALSTTDFSFLISVRLCSLMGTIS